MIAKQKMCGFKFQEHFLWQVYNGQMTQTFKIQFIKNDLVKLLN